MLLPDGSTNHVRGSYVARIYKSVELNEEGTEVVDSKKLHKYDAAFYSKMSMNIDGEETDSGVLNIWAENEGLDSELHLTINGGQINIVSGNDGINTNEDNVSVTTINGGTVVAGGNMPDHISDSEQGYVVFMFSDKVKGGEEITLMKDEESHFVSMPNDYTYLLMSKASFGDEGVYTLWKGDKQLSVIETSGGGMMMPGDFGDGQMPEDFEPGQMPNPVKTCLW